MLLLSLPWKSKGKTDESQAPLAKAGRKVEGDEPKVWEPISLLPGDILSHLYRLEVHRAVYGVQFIVHTTESNSKKLKVHFLSSRNYNLVSKTNHKYNKIMYTAVEARTC